MYFSWQKLPKSLETGLDKEQIKKGMGQLDHLNVKVTVKKTVNLRPRIRGAEQKKNSISLSSWIKVDHIHLYLTPGPRGDGCLPRCGSEPSQHRQVSEQPQNHGPRHQAECQIWSTTTAVDRKKGPKPRGEWIRGGEPQGRSNRGSGWRVNWCDVEKAWRVLFLNVLNQPVSTVSNVSTNQPNG